MQAAITRKRPSYWMVPRYNYSFTHIFFMLNKILM